MPGTSRPGQWTALPNSSSIPSSSPAFATPAFPLQPFTGIPSSTPARNPAAASESPAPILRATATAATASAPLRPTILPIKLPPATLRSIAFRTFTKKHNLTLTPGALAQLAAFVGRHCGAGWRDEGLAEGVLDEVAREWKKHGGGVIVQGSDDMDRILKSIEPFMVGGRVERSAKAKGDEDDLGIEEDKLLKDIREWVRIVDAFEMPRLVFNPTRKLFDRATTAPSLFPPPKHRIAAFRNRYNLTYHRVSRNAAFMQSTSLVGTSSSATNTITSVSNLLGRHNTTHLLFGLLSYSATGLLALSDPSGTIVLDITTTTTLPSPGAAWFTPGMLVLVEGVYREDGTAGATEQTVGASGGIGGTINGVFVATVMGHPPGERRALSLGQTGGDAAFGWTDFLGLGSERESGDRMRKIMNRILSVEARERERRQRDLDMRMVDADVDMDRLSLSADSSAPLPPIQSSIIAVASCLDLSAPATFPSLRTLLKSYSTSPPIAIVLMGPFSTTTASFPLQPRPPAALSSSGPAGMGLVEYKEGFDALAAVLAEFPALLARTSLVFVPADADAWPSAVGNGAAVPLPQKGIPELFTRRVKRVGLEASRSITNSNSSGSGGDKGANSQSGTAPGSNPTFCPTTRPGEIVWTTNPSRISWFGCVGEMVLLRDDLLGRLQRQSITFPAEAAAAAAAREEAELNLEDDEPVPTAVSDLATARRMTKTLLDQGYLSPFPINNRPVYADYASSLNVYPLPSAIVVADADAPPWAIQYLGCWVMNPGALVVTDGEDGGVGTVVVGGGGDSQERSALAPSTDQNEDKAKGGNSKAAARKAKESLFASGKRRGGAGGDVMPGGPARWVEFDIRTGKGRVRIERE